MNLSRTLAVWIPVIGALATVIDVGEKFVQTKLAGSASTSLVQANSSVKAPSPPEPHRIITPSRVAPSMQPAVTEPATNLPSPPRPSPKIKHGMSGLLVDFDAASATAIRLTDRWNLLIKTYPPGITLNCRLAEALDGIPGAVNVGKEAIIRGDAIALEAVLRKLRTYNQTLQDPDHATGSC